MCAILGDGHPWWDLYIQHVLIPNMAGMTCIPCFDHGTLIYSFYLIDPTVIRVMFTDSAINHNCNILELCSPS